MLSKRTVRATGTRSNSRRTVPNDHRQYGTVAVVCRFAARLLGIQRQAQHCRPSVKGPQTRFCGAFDNDLSGSQEGLDSRECLWGAHAWKFNLPMAGLKSGHKISAARHDDIDHIQAWRQHPIQRLAHQVRVALRHHTDFDVLGLTSHPCGGGVGVRNLRVW